jgi:hypothetical protein
VKDSQDCAAEVFSARIQQFATDRIGDPERGVLGIGIGAFIFSGDSNHVDAQTLRQLSNETGARTYLLGKVGDGELLRQDCTDISNELREQYTLGFGAPDASRPSYRSLRVEPAGQARAFGASAQGGNGWDRGLSRPTPVRAGRRR